MEQKHYVTRLTTENIGAVVKSDIELNGCSILITGQNTIGKSTSSIEYFRKRISGLKQDRIVREGENEGKKYVELDNGAKFYMKGYYSESGKEKDKIAFITPNNEYQTGIIKTIAKEYFGESFDINRFLYQSESQQLKDLQRICGFDFSELDNEYKELYKQRTELNAVYKNLQSKRLTKKEIVHGDLDSLQNQLQSLENQNAIIEKEYQKELKESYELHEKRRKFVEQKQAEKQRLKAFQKESVSILNEIHSSFCLFTDTEFLVNLDNLIRNEYSDLELPKHEQPQKPILQDASYLKIKISETENIIRENRNYVEWQKELSEKAKLLSEVERKIEINKQSRKDIVENSDLPEGFEISGFGNKMEILYEGNNINKSGISLSQKMIAGLKLASRLLGKINCIHFDASTLDKNSLLKVVEWAENQIPRLQLIIEKPADNSEIKITTIEEYFAN